MTFLEAARHSPRQLKLMRSAAEKRVAAKAELALTILDAVHGAWSEASKFDRQSIRTLERNLLNLINA